MTALSPGTTPLTGAMLIGGEPVLGRGHALRAVDPATGEELEPAYPLGGAEDVERACALAEAAFAEFRATTAAQRAALLERIAENVEALGDALPERARRESGLPLARLTGERARTTGQLRLFASVLREGGWQGVRIDPAQPDRRPLPRPDIRQRRVPLGPVAVFGASNFPLAFSVAGGDTASALAAGCPVVVKGHEAHPGTSELVGRAVAAAVRDSGLPAGVFGLLFGEGPTLGAALARDPRIRAVGFTGSRAAGLSLVAAAAGRPRPIPVYAEMSSVNPVFLLPGALARGARELARAFVASLTLGAGQFCTNPGVVVAVDGPDLAAFLDEAVAAVSAAEPATMLTPRIARGYEDGVAALASRPGVEILARGATGAAPAASCRAALLAVDAGAFLSSEELHQEVFGASSLAVRCADTAELARVAEALEGQLTATVHTAEADHPLAAELLPVLELRAGRIVFGGWPTGVEVGHAMVHGGPFPATSDSRTTSVGSLAIERFLRPVAYQDVPAALLPGAVADGNPEGLPRLVDGEHHRA